MSIFNLPRAYGFNTNGVLMSGAKLNFYTAGTDTRKDTYSDSALTTANANPVVADSSGLFAGIYLGTGGYKVVLTNSSDVVMWTQDNVNSDDANSITYNQGGTGAVDRSIQSRLQDIVSAKDFGSTAAAITAAIATGKDVFIPEGTWDITGVTFSPSTGQTIYGAGPGKTILQKTATATALTEDYITLTSVNDVTIRGIQFKSSGGSGQYGVTMDTCTFINIHDCHFNGSSMNNIFVFKNSTDVIISRNSFDDGKFGVATGGDRSGNTNGSIYRVTISDNIFKNTETEAIDVNWDSHHVLIENNQFYNCCVDENEEVIDVGGGASPNHCEDIVIRGNIIDMQEQGTRGIRIKESAAGTATDRFIVEGNIIRRSSMTGVADTIGVFVEIGTNGVIANNYIEYCERGVALADTSCLNVSIANNVIRYPSADAILLSGTGTHERVTIIGNIVDATNATAVEQLIDISGPCTDILIADNILEGPGITTAGDGIRINSTSATRVTIRGNQIRSSGQGIGVISAATQIVIDGNFISDCWTDGIDLGTSSTRIRVTNNEIVDCDKADAGTGWGITCTTPDTLIMTGNHVYDTRTGAARTLRNGIRVNTSGARVTYVGNAAINIADAESIATLSASVNASNNVTDVAD